MERMNFDSKHRFTGITAIILVVVLLSGILFSYDFIIENAHHDCSGENCPICIEIDQAAQIISNIRFVPVLPFVVAVLCVFTRKGVSVKTLNDRINTLITLKVEALN